ncbi:MAG: serine protease [Actinomycetota bacterium]
MRIPTVPVFGVLAVFLLIATACQAETRLDLDDVAAPAASPDATSDAGERGSREPAAAVADARFSPAAVFDEVANSVVFIETGEATGTGIVIEGGWVLTNAHVVESHAAVRVGRSDGTDLGMHPIFSSDLVFDLALIGPIEDSALVPFERFDTSAVDIGDDVMLIGFPDEVILNPTPTLTSGIVSRRRHLAIGDFPFLQVDATIAGGQSGGALVDGSGNLLGISGLEFGEGEFGLVFEGNAVWPRVDGLLLGPTDQIPTTDLGFSFSDIVGPRRTAGYLLEVSGPGVVDVSVQGADDLYIDIRTLGGLTFGQIEAPDDVFVVPFGVGDEQSFFIDEELEGGEDFRSEMPEGNYIVIVGSFAIAPAPMTVSSSVGLRPFRDVEEGAELPTGRVVEGVFDWAGDSDKWELALDAGAEVTIIADGLPDMIMAVRLDGVPVASNDDDFLGLYGTTSRVGFVADQAGTYEVEIGSFNDSRWGYVVEATVN